MITAEIRKILKHILLADLQSFQQPAVPGISPTTRHRRGTCSQYRNSGSISFPYMNFVITNVSLSMYPSYRNICRKVAMPKTTSGRSSIHNSFLLSLPNKRSFKTLSLYKDSSCLCFWHVAKNRVRFADFSALTPAINKRSCQKCDMSPDPPKARRGHISSFVL